MKSNWHQKMMRVNYKDTDQMGVGHHANYVTWFEMGRTECMRHHGIAYREMEKLGLFLPVLNLDVNYKKPAYYDDCLAIFTRVVEFSKVRLAFEYEARRVDYNKLEQDTQQSSEAEPYGELLASGHTLHMWLNHDWKPTRLDRVTPEIYNLLRSILNKDD